LAAAKAAAAAGVKPAALITKLNPHDRTIPKPAFELTEKKLDPKAASAKKAAAKPRLKKTTKTARLAPAKKEVAKHPGTPKAKPASHAAPPKSAWKKPPASSVAANTVSSKPSPAVAKPSAGAASN
jgi:hypothetical protein